MKLILLSAAALSVAPMAEAVSPAEAKSAVTAKFVVTKRSMLTAKVTEPGTVAVIQQAGLSADPSNTSFMKPVVIQDGVLTASGGGNVLGPSGGKAMKPGTKIYLYSVDANKTSITIMYGTLDTFETMTRGSTTHEFYKGAIVFKYATGLASVDTAKLLSDLQVWFKTEGESAVSGENTIALGQTPEQVEGMFGAPDKKVDLGAKKIFIYKDMKVTFTDGKVSDVE